MTLNYTTVELVKGRLSLRSDISDSGETDALVSQKISVASRRIEDDCGRRFWQDDVLNDRYYDITHKSKVVVDDISTTTGLVISIGNGTSFTTLPATSYRLKPMNAIADGESPYIIERVNYPSNYCQPYWGIGMTMKVTAKFGWLEVPDPISEACLLLATRLYRRKDSPEGFRLDYSGGFSGFVTKTDSDYDALIDHYIRKAV